MNTQTVKMINEIEENYIPLDPIDLKGNKFIYLGIKMNRICRFCNKKVPEVSFKNIAHAIPEFIGNKRLISYYECDDCNSKFSRLLENNMANYMALNHSLSQVKGKHGIPSFKSNKKKSRIDMTNEGLHIQSHDDDSIFNIDDAIKTLKIEAKIPTYIPIAVYKCLTKMALTIIPEDELKFFNSTFNWINEENHLISSYDLKNLKVIFTMISGINPFRFIHCQIYKRKPEHKKNVPYMMFLLAYSNYSFQIFLPLCTEDCKYFGKDIQVIYLPTPFDTIEENKIVPRQIIDMHSKERVIGEKGIFAMGYDSTETKTIE